MRRPVYERTSSVLRVIILGLPISQGSKTIGVGKSGRPYLREATIGIKEWRQTVQATMRDALALAVPPEGGFPLLGPLSVDRYYTMRKPVSAPKTRTTFPIVKPDLDKLDRAIFDSGTKAGLWHDDSQILDGYPAKVYPLETHKSLSAPGVLIYVHMITAPINVARIGEQLALAALNVTPGLPPEPGP